MRVALLSAAHLHAHAYASVLAADARVEVVEVWDDDEARGTAFAASHGLMFEAEREALLGRSDAAIIASENRRHRENVSAAARFGLPILCEKPLATTVEEAEAMEEAVGGGLFMTAFPCRFHPAWGAAKERASQIGRLRSVVATNRGRCPGGWFVEEGSSGGGAMMDHTVHVADLLRDLLGAEPTRVEAFASSAMNGGRTDDCALLTLTYPSGVHATLDASWSRPANFRTWGDVTMRIVGDEGVVEFDMFRPSIGRTTRDGYADGGIGSDADAMMISAFVRACLDGERVLTTLADGLAASRVAIEGYRSLRGQRRGSIAASPT